MTPTPIFSYTPTHTPSTTATPTATATSAPGSKPDLVVLDLWTERSAGNCAGAAIKMTIRNQGNAAATSFWTQVYFQGAVVPNGVWWVDLLAAGSEQTFTLAEAAAGAGQRLAWADVFNAVDENDEENNQLSVVSGDWPG